MTLFLLACFAYPPSFHQDSALGWSDSATGGASDSGSSTPKGDPSDPRAPMCQRWNAAHADLSEAVWSGSTGGCNAGDLDAEGRGRALELLNTFRSVAGQPEVIADDARNDEAQDCALMLHANGALSHDPPTDWSCYSQAGASAAGASNIATAPAVSAMDMYMQDWGNETTIGHRRWFLSNKLGPVGIGSTSDYSCIYVVGGAGLSGRRWSAWPPEGYFPHQAITVGGYTTLDENGWTIQSDEIDLDEGEVTVTEDGVQVPVDVQALLNGYGSEHALKITPSGWASKAGATYHVQVTGVSEAIDYDVEMVDCDAW